MPLLDLGKNKKIKQRQRVMCLRVFERICGVTVSYSGSPTHLLSQESVAGNLFTTALNKRAKGVISETRDLL